MEALDLAAAERRLQRSDLALSTGWKEPQTPTEAKLAVIWQDVLGVDRVGTADDFFELGGNSFSATVLATQIEATCGVRFTPADILSCSTVASQAQAVAADADSASRQSPSHLILGRAGGSKSPAFMVHGGPGFVFLKPVFLDIVAEDRSIYLFQAPGLDDSTTPLESVEKCAGLYIKAMRATRPPVPITS